MAQPHQSQPIALRPVGAPDQAPPSYEEVLPPSPAYHYSRELHRRDDCARPPPYHAPSPPAPRRPVNPVVKLYSRINACNALKWAFAIVCLGASAAFLIVFPASSLRPVLIYLIIISVLHLFPAKTIRPFSNTTPRPPLWHFCTLAISTAAWVAGAVALLILYYQDKENGIPTGDSADERKEAGSWENAVIMAAVAAILAVISCLWQGLNTMRLLSQFVEGDVREAHDMMWVKKRRARQRRAVKLREWRGRRECRAQERSRAQRELVGERA